MPLLIDAYNVLLATGALPPELAGLEVDDLIDLIADSRYGRRHAGIICDGRPRPNAPAGEFGRINVVYSGHDQTADDVIVSFITKSSAPARLLVVTSDRDIVVIANRRGCSVLTSNAFLEQLAEDWLRRLRGGRRKKIRKPQVPLSSAEVDYWMAAFGLSNRDSAGLFTGATFTNPTPNEIDAIDMDEILEDGDAGSDD